MSPDRASVDRASVDRASVDWAFVEQVRVGLATSGDPDRAIAQQRYMKSEMAHRGVTSPS